MQHEIHLAPLAWTRLAPALLAGALLAPLAGAQSLSPNGSLIPAGAPFNASATESVDFGDVDLDGDFDAVFADGGNSGNDQNRIWINQGGLQAGTTGVFVDETAARLPAVNDTSRDVDLVDIDADADLDGFVSNTSSITAQTSRWWVNQGRRQGGQTGWFVDETAARWVGLGGPGSSIAPGLLVGGGYVAWSCDSDFADLDDDGDLDLFHSSYGGAFSGQVPSRVFLNDGDGFFEEFNPSGFQVAGMNIANGDPGLWCEGTQQANTLDATGAECDVASSAVDIDPGDVDGDLDLDVLHGARQEAPRLFANRLEENGGALSVRDVTGASFQAGYASGQGHYEQELGDLDGDGDLDIYGVNWSAFMSFSDLVLENDGSGFFGQAQVVPSSSNDDNEADFLDYDNDGDLDVYVAAWAGNDKLYRNDTPAGGPITLVLTVGELAAVSGPITLDADACDVDLDGDYDVLAAHDNNAANVLYENLTQVPDTHAPQLHRLQQAPDRAASQQPTVVRVQVYDNAPYYVTWFNPTWLEARVVGGELLRFRMRASYGQVFRGELPGWWTGTVEYRAVSEDLYGNRAETSFLSYLATGPFTGQTFCSGNEVDCPCGNRGREGGGCENSQSTGGGLLTATGAASVAGDSLALSGRRMTAGSPALYFQGTATVNGTFGAAFGDGLRCVAGDVRRLATVVNDANGASAVGAGFGTGLVSALGAVPPAGARRFCQAWYRNVAPHCAPEGFNLTNAVALDWTP